MTLQFTLSINLIRSLIAEFLHPFDISCLHRTCKRFREYFQKQVDEIRKTLDTRNIVIHKKKSYHYNYTLLQPPEWLYHTIYPLKSIDYGLSGNIITITTHDNDPIDKNVLECIERYRNIKIDADSKRLNYEELTIIHDFDVCLMDVLANEDPKSKGKLTRYVYKGADIQFITEKSSVKSRTVSKITYDYLETCTIIQISNNHNNIDMCQEITELLKKNRQYHYCVPF